MKIGIVVFGFWLAVIAGGLLGYVLNVISFVQHFGSLNEMEVFRLIGVIIPFVGALLGWFA